MPLNEERFKIRNNLFKIVKEAVWLPLLLIILLGLIFRVIGLEWDQGYGLHPDERMLIMVTQKVSLANLNPEFFNYGNWPIYSLKFISFISSLFLGANFVTYPALFMLGRLMSSFYDIGTLVLIYFITKYLWDVKSGLMASFLYSVCVFPLQNAHYYTVDTQLTFWLTLCTLVCVTHKNRNLFLTMIFSGITLGFAAATKITGILGLVLPLIVLLQHLVTTYKGSENRKEDLLELLANIGTAFILLSISLLIVFFVTQPYVLIDYQSFYNQISQQLKMNSDARTFPYTLQFLNTRAYIQPLSDIIRYGLGFPLGIISLVGLGWVTYFSILEKNWKKIILLSFFYLYFLVIGRSAVKFMRYYLPIYPIMIIVSAVLISDLHKRIYLDFGRIVERLFLLLIIVSCCIYPFAFISIYLSPHSRVAATDWMNQNLPTESVLAIEHWDDQVPLKNDNFFNFETLEVYQPESNAKWQKINSQLMKSNYLVISSSRVYGSIMNWPQMYPYTTNFYQKIFASDTNYKLIKEFTSYPRLKIGSYQIEFSDNQAQESFTSYDHPKVMLFCNIDLGCP